MRGFSSRKRFLLNDILEEKQMQTKDNWIGVYIKYPPAILEELSAYFFAMGCQGINELEYSFQLFFYEKDFTDSVKEQLFTLLNSKGIDVQIVFNKIEPENWNENWKENFKTFRVGKKIIVIPDWETYEAAKDETVITIAPKMAFGTGHHETTQLILDLMEDLITPGMSVLDAGTGSAILAIYAALSGAGTTDAFDNDPDAIENAEENCELNGVSSKINLYCDDLSGIEKKEYDLIIANINRNVLLNLAAPFLDYSTKGNNLILSGLLQTDYDDILKKYSEVGWQLQKSKQQGEWMALLMKNGK